MNVKRKATPDHTAGPGVRIEHCENNRIQTTEQPITKKCLKHAPECPNFDSTLPCEGDTIQQAVQVQVREHRSRSSPGEAGPWAGLGGEMSEEPLLLLRVDFLVLDDETVLQSASGMLARLCEHTLGTAELYTQEG